MGKRISSWIELLQSLKEAFIGVLRAEIGALQLDFETSTRRLIKALGLATGAIFVIFWSIGLLVLLLIQVAGLWLPLWAATLVVLAMLLILSMALVTAARGNLRRIEAPKAMVRRHVQEHMDWWEDEVLPGSDAAGKKAVSRDEGSGAHDRDSS